nr:MULTISPECIES: hypothetical protein [unclassified Erysipelothrix]
MEMNKYYNLGMSLKSDSDLFKLDIFKHSLETKKAFENEFERIRNEHFDMWDNLLFNERNFIVQCDIAPMKSKLKVFQIENENRVYIPFFDPLLNTLYDRETAILELPQYFKLYSDFQDRLISSDIYGLNPYIANMSSARFIARNEEEIVLFRKDINVFYRFNLKGCESFPLWIEKQLDAKQIKQVADLILTLDETKLLDYCIENELIKPRCIKKINKQRVKAEKKSRR